jgi:hypothetical protein
LFAGTVRENILYGATQGTTDEDVQRAAGLANAHDFIMELAEGYDTQVGCRLHNPLPLSPFLAKRGGRVRTQGDRENGATRKSISRDVVMKSPGVVAPFSDHRVSQLAPLSRCTEAATPQPPCYHATLSVPRVSQGRRETRR